MWICHQIILCYFDAFLPNASKIILILCQFVQIITYSGEFYRSRKYPQLFLHCKRKTKRKMRRIKMKNWALNMIMKVITVQRTCVCVNAVHIVHIFWMATNLIAFLHTFSVNTPTDDWKNTLCTERFNFWFKFKEFLHRLCLWNLMITYALCDQLLTLTFNLRISKVKENIL